MNRTFLKISFLFLLFGAVVSCKKNNYAIDQDIVPPTFVKFNTLQPADSAGTYFIRSNNNVFKIPIGVTTVSNTDRTIQLTYSSNSAVQGQQYTAPATITIPAGKAVDTLTIQGNFAGYTSSSRVDTLKITVGGTETPTNAYKGTYTLYMRKYCEVDINALAGDYNNTREDLGGSVYGPYQTAISNIVPISATKARVSVENIYDYGWGPIEFELDWSNPANHTVTVVAKSSGIGNAGTLSSAYTGQQVAVRSNGRVGTFNACDPSITLSFQLGAASATGTTWFSSSYIVTMRR
ncbi:hypothetical protein HRH25_11005 [Flavisolibacter sp. BT320]|nr:hypothetical protein [Flavisolibacter longurius]